LDWIGLDWIGLDWMGLDWIGWDWIGLDWVGSVSRWAGLHGSHKMDPWTTLCEQTAGETAMFSHRSNLDYTVSLLFVLYID